MFGSNMVVTLRIGDSSKMEGWKNLYDAVLFVGPQNDIKFLRGKSDSEILSW